MMKRQTPRRGLCGSCVHARLVATRSGSEFLRCGRSDADPSYPRYPALPVLRCAGHERLPEAPPPGGSG
jgi:hypothetical protein